MSSSFGAVVCAGAVKGEVVSTDVRTRASDAGVELGIGPGATCGSGEDGDVVGFHHAGDPAQEASLRGPALAS